MGTLQVFGTIAIVTLALGLALALPMGSHGGSSTTATSSSSSSVSTATSSSSVSTATSSSSVSTATSSSSATTQTTTTVTSSGEQSIYADSQDGLQLRLAINTSQVYPGGTILVNVSEFNTLNQANNVTEAAGWQIRVALSSCPNTNVQPFGIAVYRGHYTAQNVSQGTQLQIFPMTACPMYVRLVTGYYFQPNSDIASVEPGSGLTPMTGGVVVDGTYGGSAGSMALIPGTYTVVAADEWGATAFLYFQVNGLP